MHANQEDEQRRKQIVEKTEALFLKIASLPVADEEKIQMLRPIAFMLVEAELRALNVSSVILSYESLFVSESTSVFQRGTNIRAGGSLYDALCKLEEKIVAGEGPTCAMSGTSTMKIKGN